MKRLGCRRPLLIGGATTSSIHTAVRISPEYDQPVVYVQDASRVVGVVSSLLNPRVREEFLERNRKDQERRRRDYLERQQNRRMLTLQQARKNITPIDWKRYQPRNLHSKASVFTGKAWKNRSEETAFRLRNSRLFSWKA